ncbi:HDOD domain-containing protein [Chromobacterium sp. IIBBL 290-4]|uniref:HDOD domain-containing protein n=1 Tax=Chromobacterium sp. IIBBL 290-4 TaxID=2953890 RepID=UPI0020B7582A|nr:HDOD domain-containing protein [Chromobacterium sp. IIBBL 290-4]UTH74789.1 HDOD domain-containing protein [Chromobacterium sp. IIBBL 290-4]
MSTELSEIQRDQLLQNLVIPPRPEILDRLQALRNDSESPLQELSDIVTSDPALSIAMLKAANSPALGQGRKIQSISQAINLLGVNNVIHLASGLVLRSRLTQESPAALELFWERAMQVAAITGQLSERLTQAPDECQSFALFHACGIAILLMREPNYPRTLQLMEIADDIRACKVEQQLHGTDHAIVGYLVAKVWNMPENFARAIQVQYDPDVFHSGPGAPLDHDGRMMVAITRAALHIWRTATPGREDPGWPSRSAAVLAYLGLDLVEFEDWRDHLHQQMAGV